MKIKTEIELQEQEIIALISELNMLYSTQKNIENKYTFEVVLLADSANVDAINLDLDHYRIDTFPGEPKVTLPKVQRLLENMVNEFRFYNSKNLSQGAKLEESVKDVKQEIKQTEEAILEIADKQKSKGFELNEAFISDFNKMRMQSYEDLFSEDKTPEQVLYESLMAMLEQEVESDKQLKEKWIESDPNMPCNNITPKELQILFPEKYGEPSNIQITTPHEQPVIEEDFASLQPIHTLTPFQQWVEDGKSLLIKKGDALMKEADEIANLYTILLNITK